MVTALIVWAVIATALALAPMMAKAHGRRVRNKLAADRQAQREEAEWLRKMKETP